MPTLQMEPPDCIFYGTLSEIHLQAKWMDFQSGIVSDLSVFPQWHSQAHGP